MKIPKTCPKTVSGKHYWNTSSIIDSRSIMTKEPAKREILFATIQPIIRYLPQCAACLFINDGTTR